MGYHAGKLIESVVYCLNEPWSLRLSGKYSLVSSLFSVQVRDQHGVLRARFQLGQFGGKFLLELCCIRIGGNSCVPARHISRREVRKNSQWDSLFVNIVSKVTRTGAV